MSKVQNKKIKELISENYLFASILYFFGIEFYNYSENTLEQVCKEKGLQVSIVISSLEEAVKSEATVNASLIDFPVDLLIEYLKHAHYTFVKQRLPYLAKCIDKFDLKQENYPLAKDLKFVFPLFLEDFIRHIYEEEDQLFSYILSLQQVLNNNLNVNKLYFQMEKHSLHDFAIEHSSHEDEMSGMRRITNNYDLSNCENIFMKVILSELKALDQELKTHARIEDEILFPKALILEKEVKDLLRKNIIAN